MTIASARFMVSANAGSFAASPASSDGIGSVATSISSVWIPGPPLELARERAAPRARSSDPCARVPRMTGMESGLVGLSAIGVTLQEPPGTDVVARIRARA